MGTASPAIQPFAGILPVTRGVQPHGIALPHAPGAEPRRPSGHVTLEGAAASPALWLAALPGPALATDVIFCSAEAALPMNKAQISKDVTAPTSLNEWVSGAQIL